LASFCTWLIVPSYTLSASHDACWYACLVSTSALSTSSSMRLRDVSSCSRKSSSCWSASASMRATSSSYFWRVCSWAPSRCCASSATALSCRFFASASAAARRCSICCSLTADSLDRSTSARSASR
jgi:hypothetical protein